MPIALCFNGVDDYLRGLHDGELPVLDDRRHGPGHPIKGWVGVQGFTYPASVPGCVVPDRIRVSWRGTRGCDPSSDQDGSLPGVLHQSATIRNSSAISR